MSDRRKKLFPHQIDAIQLAREKVNLARQAGKQPRVVVQSPTGSGKTVLTANLSWSSVLKSRRVLIMVPRRTLVEQTIEQLKCQGFNRIGIGVIAGSYDPNPAASVQVATVQALSRRLAKGLVEPCDLVFVDEAHEQYKVIRELMEAWPKAVFIGLSATPWSKGMGAYWYDLVIPTTIGQLIETINPATGRTFLSPFKVYAPPSGLRPDLSKIATSTQMYGSDYVTEQLSREMSREPLVADAVPTWLQMARGRPTLVFAVDKLHAKALHARFLASGVCAEYVDCDVPVKERDAIRDRLEVGATDVVVSINTLQLGCDWPFVSCIELCRPTKSEIWLVQAVGRGLRSAGLDTHICNDTWRGTGITTARQSRPPGPAPTQAIGP
jgi:superfamily II DNA or RNA helicase